MRFNTQNVKIEAIQKKFWYAVLQGLSGKILQDNEMKFIAESWMPIL